MNPRWIAMQVLFVWMVAAFLLPGWAKLPAILAAIQTWRAL